MNKYICIAIVMIVVHSDISVHVAQVYLTIDTS